MAETSSTILGYGNVAGGATLGGSGWETDYPVTNLQSWPKRALATGTSATITASFGAIAGPVIGIGRHNLTTGALVSVTAGGFTATSQTCDCFVVPSTESVSSVTISISDAGNPDGYISIGKLFIGTAFRPAAGVNWGQVIGSETMTEVATALSGTEFFLEKPVRRTWRGSWSWLTPAEAALVMGVQKSHGIIEDVCIVQDYTDTTNRWRSFVGRLRALNEIEWPYLTYQQFACEIAEHL